MFTEDPYVYSGEITYNMPWSTQLTDPTSTEYKNLVQDVTRQVSIKPSTEDYQTWEYKA